MTTSEIRTPSDVSLKISKTSEYSSLVSKMEEEDKIFLLDDIVINQIKAGEVVERPLNIVKELIENSLDAGASSIRLELLDGGRQLIRVVDNGRGISTQNLRVSVLRHATSKLKVFDDLLNLGSFGFRGEALPSIAAVGSLTIESRKSDDVLGSSLNVDFGQVGDLVENVPVPIGTAVTVKHLFENLPVRKKFLRSSGAELSLILECVLAMAMCYHAVSFVVLHNGKNLLNYPKTKSFALRMSQVLGSSLEGFFDLNKTNENYKVMGYIGKPECARSSPSHFVTFVNGRYVKDRWLRSSIVQSYSGLLSKGLVPSVILFLSLPSASIDVNAHPSKTQIRFLDPLLVQEFIIRSLREVLHSSLQEPLKNSFCSDQKPSEQEPSVQSDYDQDSQGTLNQNVQRVVTDIEPHPEIQRVVASQFGGQETSFKKESGALRNLNNSSINSSSSMVGDEVSNQNSVFLKQNLPLKPPVFVKENRQVVSPKSSQKDLFSFSTSDKDVAWTSNSFPTQSADKLSSSLELAESKSIKNATYVGQFFNCYLVFESKDQLFVVDQHAFHERILYEKYKVCVRDAAIQRQYLLAPILVPIPQEVLPLLEESMALFKSLGFEMDMLHSGRIGLLSYPSLLNFNQIVPLFDDLLVRLIRFQELEISNVHPLLKRASTYRAEAFDASLPQLENAKNMTLKKEEMLHECLSSVACHSAIRSGAAMDSGLVEQLLGESRSVDFFAHCPHGRPVFKSFDRKDVGLWFQRPV